MRRALRIGAVAAAIGIAAGAAAVVPSAERVLKALGSANRSEGRGERLRLGVDLVRGDDVVGQGLLLTDPSGAARLELRGSRGLEERHLRDANGYRATRNGQPLDAPKPLLPPMALLQAGSSTALVAQLVRLGARPEAIALGRAGDFDCYVVGGRAPGPDRGEPPLVAALWVDSESLAPVRIDRADGVRYGLGPPREFGKRRLPAWISVEVPGQAPLRLLVREVEVVPPRPDDFAASWLAG